MVSTCHTARIPVQTEDKTVIDLDGDSFVVMSGRSLYITHRQVTVTHPCGRSVSVDVGIAPLLQRLWDYGLRTFYSCQGFYSTDPAYRPFNISAYVQFEGKYAAETFRDTALSVVGMTVHVDESTLAGRSVARFHAGDVAILGEQWGFDALHARG